MRRRKRCRPTPASGSTSARTARRCCVPRRATAVCSARTARTSARPSRPMVLRAARAERLTGCLNLWMPTAHGYTRSVRSARRDDMIPGGLPGGVLIFIGVRAYQGRADDPDVGSASRSLWAWACPRCAGPGRCAARRAAGVPASRPLTGCRPSREHGQAGDAGRDTRRPCPVPGDRGPCFLHAARERGPLGELTGLQVAALGAAPVRSPPRSPAMPVAGPLNAGVQ